MEKKMNQNKAYTKQTTLIGKLQKLLHPTRSNLVWGSVVGGAVLSATAASVIYAHYRKRHKKIEKKLAFTQEIKGVELGSNIHLTVKFSSQEEQQLTVNAESRLQDSIMCDIRGSRLRLYLMLDPKERTNEPLVFATITVSELATLSLSGYTTVEASGVNDVRNFSLKQHNGEVKGLNIRAKRFSYSATGIFASDITFEGGQLNSSIIGNGVSHLALNAKVATMRLSGESCSTILGNVNSFNAHLSGNSELIGENFTIPRGTISLVDKAKAEFKAIEVGTVSLANSSFLSLSKRPARAVKMEVCDGAELYLQNEK